MELADQIFSHVVGEMAEAFATRPSPPALDAETAPVAAAETAEPALSQDELYPGLAYALNREADGLGQRLRTIATEPRSPSDSEPKGEIVRDDDSQEPQAITPRGERIATAVRLTGQAMQAWLSVLQQSPTIASTQH